jgi:hypothetical protein
MYRMIALISTLALTLTISTAQAATWKQVAARTAGVGKLLTGQYAQKVQVGLVNPQGTKSVHNFKIVKNRVSGGKTLKATTTIVQHGIAGQTLGEAVKYQAGMGGTPVAASSDNAAKAAGRKASVKVKKTLKDAKAPLQYLGQLLKSR